VNKELEMMWKNTIPEFAWRDWGKTMKNIRRAKFEPRTSRIRSRNAKLSTATFFEDMKLPAFSFDADFTRAWDINEL
jgi:hypothetical protein